MKHQYKVIGMSCASCEVNVENSLSSLKEISKVNINLKKSEVELEMSSHVDLSKLQETLMKSGLHYTIENFSENHEHHEHKHEEKKPPKGIYYCPMGCEGEKTYKNHGNCPACGMDLIQLQTADTSSDEDNTYKDLLKKMKIATLFASLVFIISMGDLIPGKPLSSILEQKSWNWIQFFLTLPVVFYAGWMFFVRAYKSIITRNFNMFTLVGIGTGVAFIFSIIGMIFPDIFPADFKTESGTVYLYFEATAVILTLVLLGQLLEARAHSQTSSALKELLKLAPSEATIIENGEDRVIPIEEIKEGDFLRVKPGDKIPVDGEITEGESSIDESMISGEPIPIDKTKGDKVISGTINGTKSFIMVAQKIGKDTLLSQIIEMVNTASRSRAPIQKLADTVSKYFVPIVILISLLTFGAWAIWGPEPAYVYAFVNAIAVLIIACPCALGLATPMSIMVGVGKGAQSGILIKNAEALEVMNDVDILIIDKTGTITEGKPAVEKVYSITNGHEDDLLQKIASLNKHSEHPLGKAILKYAENKKIELLDVENFESITGKGIIGIINSKKISLGNLNLMKEIEAGIPKELKSKVIAEQKLGKTVSYIAINSIVLGYISITDPIKTSSQQAIKSLIDKGLQVIMMTGDNKNTAKYVASQLDLTSFQAECLPQDKLNKIKELQKEGKIVAMAGDGINDSPALAQANVGIAMGTGTDVAIESAGITLVKGDLEGILKVKNLSYEVMKNIKQNLFFAFVYNILGVPIAAGILFPVFGILLSPIIAATAMSFSSVSVIVNSLKLKKLNLK